MENKIELLDPVHLKPLPQIKHFPRWARGSVDFDGFVEDIREHGIKHPLQVLPQNLVVDGETRRQAALSLRLSEVPCIIVSEKEAHGIILRELIRRRNLTKGQLAYLSVPYMKPALDEAQRRHLDNVRKGQQNASGIQYRMGNTVEEMASSMGFSRELLDQARRLHERFDKNPNLRREWEPRILDMEDPIGLGACLAGIGGSEPTHQTQREFGVFKRVFRPLHSYADRWGKFSATEREEIQKQWTEDFSAMPKPVREALVESLEDVK